MVKRHIIFARAENKIIRLLQGISNFKKLHMVGRLISKKWITHSSFYNKTGLVCPPTREKNLASHYSEHNMLLTSARVESM